MSRGDWGKLYATALNDKKFDDVSPLGELAWYRLIAWCVGNSHDGTFTAANFRTATELRCGKGRLRELVNAHLVDETPSGFYVHDWEERQKELVALKATRAAENERQKKSRGARAVTGSVTRDKGRDVTGSVTGAVTPASRIFPLSLPVSPRSASADKGGFTSEGGSTGEVSPYWDDPDAAAEAAQ